MVSRLREFFGYVQRGELWDGAPAYWHRGRAYRRLLDGGYILGLTHEENREICEWARAVRGKPELPADALERS